jgi:hypothetical protein
MIIELKGREIRFTLPVAPRTKKTSNQIFSFGKRCYACKQFPHHKVAPSEGFKEFEKEVDVLGPSIRRLLTPHVWDIGMQLPISVPVNINAKFYREARTGDANGLYQALGDVIQSGTHEIPCPKCFRKRQFFDHEMLGAASLELDCRGSQCKHVWKASLIQAKRSRKGIGIILDDKQIETWWGSQLLVDRNRPRIEVSLMVLDPVAGPLFTEGNE